MDNLNTVSLADKDDMEQILVSEGADKNHLYDKKILKMLKNFGRFLFVDNHKQLLMIKSYNKLLKKLEEKNIALKKKLADQNIENQKTIKMRLAINHAQRRKAIAAINILKNKN